MDWGLNRQAGQYLKKQFYLGHDFVLRRISMHASRGGIIVAPSHCGLGR